MLLRRALLENACQHSYLDLSFETGLTAIAGPNGVGKSNLMELVKATLTNDFSWTPTPKAAKIFRGVASGDKASVTTYWQHAGQEFSLTRGLKGVQDRMVVEGSSPVIGEKPIREALEKVLGVSMKLISEYLFVGQGHVADFIFHSTKQRTQSLAVLCKAERAEKVWEALGEALAADNHLRDQLQSLEEREDQLHSEMAAKQQARKEARTRVRKLKARILPKDRRELLRKTLSQGKAYGFASTTLRNAKSKLEKLEPKLQARQARVDKLMTDAAKLTTKVAKLKKPVKEAEEQLAKLDTAAAKYEKYLRWTSERKKLEKPEAPAKPEDYVSLDELTEKQALLQQKMQSTKKILDIATSTRRCSTCGQAWEMTEAEIADLSDQVAKCEKRLTRYSKQKAAAVTYERAVQTYDRKLADFESDCRRYDELIATCEVKTNPSDDKLRESLQQKVDEFEALQAKLTKNSEQQRELLPTLGKLQGKVENYRKAVKESEAKLSSISVTQEAIDRAQRKLEKHAAAKEALSFAKAHYKVASERCQELDEELTKIEEAKKTNELSHKWLADVERWRTYVHRTSLPSDLMREAVRLLEITVNQNLDKFGAPFYVTTRDDLSFDVTHNSGETEPACMLSGGQKVILSLAMYLSVSYLFAEDLGMMVLDEPTAFLDVKNLDAVADLFQNICRVTREENRQIIMITHDSRLERAFDHVITLEAAT